jgi:hypothetical protein
MTGDALSSEAVVKIALPMLVIFLIGLAAWGIRTFFL